MKHKGNTGLAMVVAIIIAIGMGIIAFIQYQITKVDSLIITTINSTQQIAKKINSQIKEEEDIGKVKLEPLVGLKEKGWIFSDANQSYHYKQEDKTVTSIYLDRQKGSVVYKIDCGSLMNEFLQIECSDELGGTGKDYISTGNVPW